MTASQRIRYRRLPGRRRGFLRGSSVWLGPDHLLAVWNLRFREEYKRFHLRDVQAIVVANAPRFHISTRSGLIGFVWLCLYLSLRRFLPWGDVAFLGMATVLVAAWIYISAACSCRCRIHTAVSRDELPSVYRTWTARRFLAQVEPRIVEVQGALEGNWAASVETATVPLMEERQPSPVESAVEPGSRAPRRNIVTDILLAVLFADALFNFATLHSSGMKFQWAMFGFNFVEVAAATVILVQHHRKTLRRGMQRLAISTLAAMGILYYLRPLAAGVLAGVQSTAQRPPLAVNPNAFMNNVIFREIDMGVTVALGLAGLAIAIFSKDS